MSTKRQILFIKNMVCPRCKEVVRQCFERMGCTVLAIELGQVVIKMHNVPEDDIIEKDLQEYGFSLLQSEKAKKIERVKTLLISLLFGDHIAICPDSISDYLELDMKMKYDELNKLFFSEYQCSIREYFDVLRFERAKELISYGELPLPNIAVRLGYSGIDELSLEFKQRLDVDIREYITAEYNYRVPLGRLI